MATPNGDNPDALDLTAIGANASLELLMERFEALAADIERDLAFADLACAAWRLRWQVIDQASRETREDAQRLEQKIVALWKYLSELGLQIQDHTGKTFESVQGVEVLAFEPATDLPQDTVIETARPTVYLNGRKILAGLVVVGTPQTASIPKSS